MDRVRISSIADQWMIPTSKTAYMAGLESKPVIAAARGVWVIDTAGKEYLDFGSGQMAAALGHNHPRYVTAVQRNLQTISHSTKTFLNVDRLELHERLGQILTPPLQKSLFLVSGSDAIEAAIDLARKATGGIDVLGLHMALHGSTSFITRSLTFGWNRGRHGLAAPSTAAILSPFCYRCPVGKSFPSCDVQCLAASMELADANFTGKPAAMIIEPVLSAGGIIVPPPGYVKLLKQYCRERDMLLIMDESQTGLGKTGKMWGHLHEDVVPDIMTVSKHFGAGLRHTIHAGYQQYVDSEDLIRSSNGWGSISVPGGGTMSIRIDPPELRLQCQQQNQQYQGYGEMPDAYVEVAQHANPYEYTQRHPEHAPERAKRFRNHRGPAPPPPEVYAA
jgi:2,2-dialkylglycine decarboxylase (pyruvate)